MRINAADRRKLWVLLPAVGLMLTAPAAWGVDKTGPAYPNKPAVPEVPSAPSTPAPDTEHGPLRYVDIGVPSTPSAPSTPPAPGIPYPF